MQAGKADSIAVIPLKPLTDSIEDFLVDLKTLLDENQIAQRPIHYVLSSNTSLAYPMCQGQVRLLARIKCMCILPVLFPLCLFEVAWLLPSVA
jgi:hypothetical protein